MHCPRQPLHLEPGLEAYVEGFPGRPRGSARRFDSGIDLHQRQPGVIEKRLARSGQLHAAHATAQKFDTHFVFKVADLPAQGRLRRVQPSLSGLGETAGLRYRDKVSKMS